MIEARRVVIPSLCVVCLFAVGLLLVPGRPALSYPDEAPSALRWEYSTENVEAGGLLVKLGELSGQGWDVFSVEQFAQGIEQGADGKTRLLVERFQVTARRPMKR
ncbi:MAG: hypothetical protein EXS05_05645 [Planctomycetaceae bacterium]|nr:hypothetical protein [Planctomycetaceae bacterium]